MISRNTKNQTSSTSQLPLQCAEPPVVRRMFCGAICFVLFLLLPVAIANGAIQESGSQSNAPFKEAFESADLPWYNPELGSLETPAIPDRGSSGLEGRNDIPEAAINSPAAPPGAAATPSNAPGLASIVVWGLGILLLAAVITLLVFAFLKIESSDAGGVGSKTRTSIQDHIARLPFEVEQTTGDFATVAQAAYQAGDYRKAIIYLYGDVLVTLDRESLIRLQKGKTNRQYFCEIRPHRELSGFYLNIMTAFEDVFFGQHEIDKERVDECFGQWKKFHDDVDAIAAKKVVQSASVGQASRQPIAGGMSS